MKSVADSKSRRQSLYWTFKFTLNEWKENNIKREIIIWRMKNNSKANIRNRFATGFFSRFFSVFLKWCSGYVSKYILSLKSECSVFTLLLLIFFSLSSLPSLPHQLIKKQKQTNKQTNKTKLKMRSHAKTFQKDQAKIKVQRSVEGDQVMIRRTQKDIRNNDGTMRLFLYAT